MTSAAIPPEQSTKTPVIVTGLSGAGMSSVLKTLEDMGYIKQASPGYYKKT